MVERPAGEVAAAQGIAAVLAAERDARDAVAAARVAAAEIVAAGRARARTILERGEQRLTRARERVEGRVAGRIAVLEEKAERLQGPVEVDDATLQRLAGAVQRLAAELTGGEA